MSEITADEEVRRGIRAKSIIEDELVKSTLDTMKQVLSEILWEDARSPKLSDEDRKRLYGQVWAVEQFEAAFRIMINGGELKKQELLSEEATRQKLNEINERAMSYGRTPKIY